MVGQAGLWGGQHLHGAPRLPAACPIFVCPLSSTHSVPVIPWPSAGAWPHPAPAWVAGLGRGGQASCIPHQSPWKPLSNQENRRQHSRAVPGAIQGHYGGPEWGGEQGALGHLVCPLFASFLMMTPWPAARQGPADELLLSLHFHRTCPGPAWPLLSGVKPASCPLP